MYTHLTLIYVMPLIHLHRVHGRRGGLWESLVGEIEKRRSQPRVTVASRSTQRIDLACKQERAAEDTQLRRP